MDLELEAERGDPGNIADALAYGELLGDALVPTPSDTHAYSTAELFIL